MGFSAYQPYYCLVPVPSRIPCPFLRRRPGKDTTVVHTPLVIFTGRQHSLGHNFLYLVPSHRCAQPCIRNRVGDAVLAQFKKCIMITVLLRITLRSIQSVNGLWVSNLKVHLHIIRRRGQEDWLRLSSRHALLSHQLLAVEGRGGDLVTEHYPRRSLQRRTPLFIDLYFTTIGHR